MFNKFEQLKVGSVMYTAGRRKVQGSFTITSIYQPTNARIISHKTLLKHFKTL